MPYIVPDAVREPLYVVVPYANPWRWKSREKHTIRAIKHFADSGAVVVLVEVAFNRREFAFANSGLDGTPANCGVLGTDHRFRHKYIGLRSQSELWLKENQINLAVSQLPWDWQQIAWIDSDVHFVRPNWAGECIHKLQHYSFLQMFSQARDLSPTYEMMPEEYPSAAGIGFVHHHMREGFPEPRDVTSSQVTGTITEARQGATLSVNLQLSGKIPPYPPPRLFPGLAWACTRKAWDDVGGLIDFAIWGGGDWHMAHALIGGKIEEMMREDLHRNYKNKVTQWYDRCRTHIRQNIGVMEGTVFHAWHGRKTDRRYNEKHRILAECGFDPDRHLKRDFQGLWQLHDDGSNAYIKIRDAMRRVAKERDEDSNDTRIDLWQ